MRATTKGYVLTSYGVKEKMDSCCTPIKHAKIKKNQGKNKVFRIIFQQNNQLQ